MQDAAAKLRLCLELGWKVIGRAYPPIAGGSPRPSLAKAGAASRLGCSTLGLQGKR